MSGIYVHIPFCKSHCTYCAFYSELLRNQQGSDAFVSALLSEIESALWLDPVETLYFGGGTPSLLGLEQIAAVKGALDQAFDMSALAEFTLEVNPDDIVKKGSDYVRGLKRLGVNRISMGVQSFDDAVLRKMGRRHNAAEAREAYAMLRGAGMDNISLDFIFGFNDALDLESMRKSLLEMGLPQHISCYQLSIEEGSGLDKMVQRGLFTMPQDEECERQYYALCEALRNLGYEHYEISNWSLPGCASRHNSAYWNHTPYIGFGPGAHSFTGRVRRWNNPSIAEYIEASRTGDWTAARGSETLTDDQLRTERLFLGLRTARGVDGKVIPEEKWFISDSIIAEMI